MQKSSALELRKQAEKVKKVQDGKYLQEIMDYCWKEMKRLASNGYCNMSVVLEQPDMYGRYVDFEKVRWNLEMELEPMGFVVEVIQKRNGDILVGVAW